MARDLFGLDAEKKIADSKIRELFTPHQPIRAIEHFFGRNAEVKRLLAQMNTPSQHSLLFGERGVGKSSLANTAARLILGPMSKGKLFEKQCDSSDTFETLIEKPLRHFGLLSKPKTTQIKTTTNESVALEKGPLKASRGKAAEASETFDVKQFSFTPSAVADALQRRHGLFVIDEADLIPRREDKRKLAELIKQLSDRHSPFKLLVVGVADTAEELTDGHPSVGRCLSETRLHRMSDDDLLRIIKAGADKTKLHFDSEVSTEIVKLSAGYPHFTHLLALKCAERAVSRDENVITLNTLWQAKTAAMEDAEATLQAKYRAAIRSSGTEMYKIALQAAANVETIEFSAVAWRDKIEQLTGRPISQNGLNNYLSKLVSKTSTNVIERVGRGIYRFKDPRLVSYIRIASLKPLDR